MNLSSIVWPSDFEPTGISVYTRAVSRMLCDLHFAPYGPGWYFDYRKTQVLPLAGKGATRIGLGFDSVVAESPGFASIFLPEVSANTLWIRCAYKPGAGWSRWVSSKRPLSGDTRVSAIAAPSGYLGAFMILDDGQLHECCLRGSWQAYTEDSTWDWYPHEPMPDVPPDYHMLEHRLSALASASGYISVFVSGYEGNLYERHFTEGEGWEWELRGRPPSVPPASSVPPGQGGVWSSSVKAVAAPTGYMGVFQRDWVGNIQEFYYDGGWLWADPPHEVPSGRTAYRPVDIAAVAAPDGRVFVFSVMRDTTPDKVNLYVLRWDSVKGWRWEMCGRVPNFVESLEAIATPWGYVGVFLSSGVSAALYEYALDGSTDGWNYAEHGSWIQPHPAPGTVIELSNDNYLQTIAAALLPTVVLFYGDDMDFSHQATLLLPKIATEFGEGAIVAQMHVSLLAGAVDPEIGYTYGLLVGQNAAHPKFYFFNRGICCSGFEGYNGEDITRNRIESELNYLIARNPTCNEYHA